MTDAEKALLASLSAEAKVALKALLKDVVDSKIPALLQLELAKLPPAYSVFAGAAEAAIYPLAQKALDAAVDSL